MTDGSFPLLMLQKRRGMDIKQMKTFVSEELKGLKQEHRLLSLREFHSVSLRSFRRNLELRRILSFRHRSQ